MTNILVNGCGQQSPQRGSGLTHQAGRVIRIAVWKAEDMAQA